MATLCTALWMMPRLLKTKLLGGRVAIAGAVLWNVGLIIGLASIASGHNDGMEWLEIPWQVGLEFVVGGAMIGLPLVLTLQRRQVEHLYVSTWYMGADLFWVPVLYFFSQIPGVPFVVDAATLTL